MRPARCLTIGFSTACVHVKAAVRFVGEHGVPVVALHPQQQLIPGDSGVVHQDVDPPVPLERGGHRALDRRRIGDVQRHRVAASAGRPHLFGTAAPSASARAPATTTAPWAASPAAIARPSPRDAPVTRATRPSKRFMTTYLLQHTRRSGATSASNLCYHRAFAGDHG